MDGRGFDDLVRCLAAGRSRRSILKGLVGGGAALVATKAGASLAAPQGKVGICHWSEDLGAYEYIEVSANSVAKHQAHQHGLDIIPADLTSDATCGDCATACGANSSCLEGSCECDEGYEKNDAGECVAGCLAGYEPSDAGCVACQPGSASNTGGSCVPCPPGQFASGSGTQACSPCPAGTFADANGTVECSACPEGTYANSTGQVACANCINCEVCNPASGVCPGTAQPFEACTHDSDCVTEVCGCGASFGPPCWCRFAECFDLTEECTGSAGDVACCEGQCTGSFQDGFFCILV